MTHPRTRTGRSLIGLVLVLMGLSAYGCGDTGTQSQPAELGNLSVSDGTLDPQFNPATTSYVVQLPTDVSSTTITASPRVAGDSIQIDNQQTTSHTVTLTSQGAEQSVNIVVTETGTGGTSKSYTILVRRTSLAGDNFLNNLTVSPGTLAPPFDKGLRRYSVSVENNIGSITITPTLSDPAATMTVNGQSTNSGQSRTINLSGGGQVTAITVAVTAQNGSTQSYEVAVSRGPSNNNNLGGLTISSGTLAPSFRADRTAYIVNIGSGVSSVRVRPTLADSTATLTVNGQAVTSGQQSQPIGLNPPGGSPTIVTIIVISQKGEPKPYSVTFSPPALNGNSNLSALTVSAGALDTPFSANDLSYTVSVGSGIDSLRVRPTLADTTATVTVNGQAVTSGQQSGPITLNPPGSQPTNIPIVVTAQNQSTKTYTVSVLRQALNGNNNLSALAVAPGTLDSPFDANDQSYTINVDSGVESVRIRPTLADTTATVTVNGQAVTSGQQSGPVTLNPAGQSTTIQTVVTALNQTTKIYSLVIVRAALAGNSNLSALTISPGTFTQPFAAARPNYTVNLSSSTVERVTVTATLQDTAASMSINGQGTSSGQARSIDLDPPGSSKTIEITITAPNGDQRIYTITVNRPLPSSNSNLSALGVTQGALIPDFADNTLSYTVNVDSAVGNVTVTATKADPNATMAIGSSTVSAGTPSGQANFPLNGAGGEPTPISVTVTAQNGVDVKTYTISVIRPAVPTPPAKPATAPDLLAADDSCPLDQLDADNDGITDECFVGSNDDNITTVKRPGFSVPKPGSGETAKLYMNGSEVPSSITENGATIILRPNADLPDGPYAVTYTLSNSVGESDKSPAMTPQLEINTIINN